MNRMYKTASAAIASLILVAGASAASAQDFGFNQTQGTAVIATGQLVQFVDFPGVVQTVCNVTINGTVGPDGESIVFNSYTGAQAPGDSGNLACDDSLFFPIEVTATSLTEISLDVFEVGTRGGPCFEEDYRLAYDNDTNKATFDGQFFGQPDAICRASGSLTLTAGGQPVQILELDENN